MNVRELIEQLQQMPEDMEVMFSYNYGDYWKTDVAAPVAGVNTIDVERSEYHQMDKVVEYDADIELDDDERRDARSRRRTVVILESR